MSASRRGSAQDRLLCAVTELAARDGYARLTVERVLDAAGVSRATFYQYFCSVDDCFSSAYRWHAERLTRDLTAALARGGRRQLALLELLVGGAIARPHAARLLMSEGLAAGPRGLLERDALIARLASTMAGSAEQGSTLDLPLPILIGATFRFLSMHLADATVADMLAASEGIADAVLAWAGAFVRRSSEPSWSDGVSSASPARVQGSLVRPIQARLDGAPRERILHATAAAVRKKGYRDVTVADIASGASISRRRFYNEFSGKPDAFTAAYEYAFEQALAVCAPAFFSSSAWPERIWQSALALTGFLSREPRLAYLATVECYALGGAFTRRVHDTQLAFALFLEEGYRQRPEARSLARSVSALTVAAVAETALMAGRAAPSRCVWRMQPLAVYIALAPFIGVDRAGLFVTGKLAGSSSRAPAAA